MTSSPSVIVRREPVVLPTYEPLPPDKNPMFLEKRVYQGSSGRVYPLPFYNRIAETKQDRSWDAVYIENQFVKIMVLPELGGRIHIGEDKTNGYNFFYRQNVIKPALVGLAGPWASGGVEFNWPQHHRPATFMPVEVAIEEHADGSKTIWLGDHDPMERMKGMHGVCLHPDRALIELKMRAYNRTPHVQSFLWWANVATHANEGYQSFFPPDVTAVADHAKRAMSRFPLCDSSYYGVDYARRAQHGVPRDEVPSHFVPPHCRPAGERAGLPTYAPNDLSWYANIPVPTSYMCLGSKEDFSGGYDHLKRAGLVQIADHQIAPGKKQWTWGNHDFGYAWDRNLTDRDGPYVELMIGGYTDNQPDFSFLQPGETKTWSVYWYPIREIGPVQAANLEAAVSLQVEDRGVRLGVATTREQPGARIELWRGEKRLQHWMHRLAPDNPWVANVRLPNGCVAEDLRLTVATAAGPLISYAPKRKPLTELPSAATEPLAPAIIPSTDELYLVGLHLWQYRHATRSPLLYWQEALRRDPGDARCNQAMGAWHLRLGEFSLAEGFLRRAIERLTSRNPNPLDGEAYYHLGWALVHQSRLDDAYDAFHKAVWNHAWQAAGYHALGEIASTRGDWLKALDHLDRALRVNTDNLRARNLQAVVLRRLGREEAAARCLAETLALDPLDAWARHLSGVKLGCDTQTRLDIALDFSRAGFFEDALSFLETATPEPLSGTAPLVEYYRAFFLERLGKTAAARAAASRAAKASPDYCFPARLEEIAILESALARRQNDARAAYYLGNLYYDRRRYSEAIALWERSARLASAFSVVWRNLGIAYFNIKRSATKARHAYREAIRANPTDARLLYEQDQLWKRLGVSTRTRLRALERSPQRVNQRDDATIELCALYNQTAQPQRARDILARRRFQPWEGGEGQVLAQHVRTYLALGREALRHGDAATAVAHFEAALHPPENLGEARHLLANSADVFYWLGEASAALGRDDDAVRWWKRAAQARGDFQDMAVRTYSEMTYFSARSLTKLGRRAEASKLVRDLERYARKLARMPAKIDYFATSLPAMLLFDDDLDFRQQTTALFLRAQSDMGLGRTPSARKRLKEVLQRDPSHGGAADLMSELKRD
ncbi:MAG: DUF5107 domain-containing protein [Opitutus sp.]